MGWIIACYHSSTTRDIFQFEMDSDLRASVSCDSEASLSSNNSKFPFSMSRSAMAALRIRFFSFKSKFASPKESENGLMLFFRKESRASCAASAIFTYLVTVSLARCNLLLSRPDGSDPDDADALHAEREGGLRSDSISTLFEG